MDVRHLLSEHMFEEPDAVVESWVFVGHVLPKGLVVPGRLALHITQDPVIWKPKVNLAFHDLDFLLIQSILQGWEQRKFLLKLEPDSHVFEEGIKLKLDFGVELDSERVTRVIRIDDPVFELGTVLGFLSGLVFGGGHVGGLFHHSHISITTNSPS